MNHDLFLDSHPLAKGSVQRLSAPAGRRIECLSGTIWVTQDGDPRDTVLEPGGAFEFDGDADALLSAFDDARYLLLEACPSPVTARGPSARRAVAAA